MAKSQQPLPPDDSSDPVDGTYDLSSPSHDGLLPVQGDAGNDPSTSGSSQTFISDEFEPTSADSKAVESDDFAEPGAESRTFISDEFEPTPADSRTVQSDEFEEPGAESRTFVSDEFEPTPADSRTVQSDEFEEPGAESKTFVSDEFDATPADSRTIQSDEFDDERPDATLGSAPEIDRTYVSEEFDGPRWGDTGAATMMVDVDGTNEDYRTIQSDNFDDDDEGLMAQSNVRQTINPKSMDSSDRKHWDSVIRGALGSQAVPSRRKRDSSLVVGVGSNLNIQTRTLVEGQPAPGVTMDYRIETKLGEGGMGAVYLANQTSLNRNVALKVIKPISDKESKRLKQSGRLNTVREHREGQFLSEAVVTGDLEHPNIVPIYDVAATQDGTVFYSMKCVSGTPWSKALKKRKLHENVDILLRVCDAIAFAHSRGVVHRDLKPENVMLGEFGVVLVMDWGLALTTGSFGKNTSIKKASSLGGSPAYMAPELATGPLDRIGPAADIYLIGAMLYEIITGRPPHSGSNVSQCLRAAATNKIDTAEQQSGELMDIALKAMATRIDDRYPTVQAFQEAVRGYLSHAESIGMAAKARADFRSARDTQQYADYARAMFGFEQALDLWEGNEPARQGLSQAQLEYAELALNKTDYELGLSLVNAKDPAHLPIVDRLRAAQREQESRKARLALLKRVAAGLLAVIFIGGSGALAVINSQKNEAVTLRKDAEESRDAAIVSEQQAEVARDEAVAERQKAELAAEQERLAKLAEAKLKTEAIALKDAAETARVAAVAAQKLAEEEQRKAELAAEQEKLAKLAEAEQRMKAEEAAVAEKLAKDKAVLAAAAEAKAKDEALAAKEAATKAKDLAVAAEKIAVDERKKAELAALAEKQAKELETKAKVAAIEAEQVAVAERKKAEAAAEAEKKAKELETQAKLLAFAAQKAEEQAKLAAVAAREAETAAKEAAIAAEKQAVYEAYVAKISLAKSRIDQNEFDSARSLLQQLKADGETASLCGWEWSFLMNQASQSASDVSAEQPARDVSFSASGKQAVAVAEGGQVELLDVSADGTMKPRGDRRLLVGADVVTAALSESQSLIATGEASGDIRLWSTTDGREVRQLIGHQGPLTKVRFLPDGRLLSASEDKTVRAWNPATGQEVASAWHIAPVQNIAFSTGATPVVAAAVADSRSGRVVVWQLQSAAGRGQFSSVGDFLGHGAPVLAVAVSRDGQRIASGDGAGRIYLWERSGVTPLDYGAAIDTALTRIAGEQRGKPSSAKPASFTSFTDDQHPLGTMSLLGDRESTAHREAVRALDFSSDATRLVSSADDFTIKVWNPAKNELIETLRGHGGWVRAVSFSPSDDDVVLSAGYDRSVKSWKLSQYTDVVTIDAAAAPAASGAAAGSPDVQAHDDEIWSARFSRDGTRVVTTSRDRSARLWTILAEGPQMRIQGPVILTDESAATGPQTLVEGHRYLALSFHASADGRRLFIGGVDGTLRVFDVRRGTELGVLPGNGLNMGFAVSDDGRLVLAASSEREVSAQLWELEADGTAPAEPRLKLSGHAHPVTAYAISADRTRLYTGDQRGIGRLWDATTGQQIGEPLTYHDGLRINTAAFLPDGRIVTGSDDLTLAVYDRARGGAPQKITQPGFVSQLSVSPDGRRSLSISERIDAEKRQTVTTLVSTDLATGVKQVVMESSADGPQVQISSVRYAPDGRRAITAHGSYESKASFLRLWNVAATGALEPARMLKLPSKLPAADAAVLLANQSYELVTLHGAAAYQWDLGDLEHHQSYRSHGSVTDACFSADGKYVATCSESVKIWDATTGKPLFKLEAPHAAAVYSVEFTPVAGRYLLATAGGDGVAKLWEWIPQQQQVAPVRTYSVAESQGQTLRDAVFSHDGTRLLTVGDGGVCRLWNVDSNTPTASLADPQSANVNYLCGAFSSDGQTVVVGAADKLARLWKVDDASLAAPQNPPFSTLTGHADRVESVAFLPGDPDAAALRVLTASRDRSARAWDAATGREVISLRKHSLGLTAVDATRVGKDGQSILVLTASLDGRVILWPTGP